MTIVLIFLVSIFIIRPLIQKKQTIVIQDKCGPFMGSIVHTIKSQDICEMRCTSQCEVDGFNYKSVDYEEGGLGRCNSCKCNCIK